MIVDAEEVNVNAMVALFVVEPLTTVVDVMVIVSGGRTNVTLGFPKNAMSTPVAVGEVYVVPSNVFVFIVIVRFEEVLKKTLLPIDVTESGMFMELNCVHW